MKIIREIHETIDKTYSMCLDRIALGTWQINDKTILEELLNAFGDMITPIQKEEIEELVKLYEKLIEQQHEKMKEDFIKKQREAFAEEFSKFLSKFKEGKFSEKDLEEFKKSLGLYRLFLSENQIKIAEILIKEAEKKRKGQSGNAQDEKSNKVPIM